MARRKELLNDLEVCADAVMLDDDFSKKRRKAFTTLEIVKNEEKQAIHNLEDIRQLIGNLEVPDTLIEKADFIEDMYQNLGSIRKAAKDRLRLVGEKITRESDAKDILRGLRGDMTLDHADQIRLEKAESFRIQELGSVYERLKTREENTREEIARLSLIKEQIKAKLSKMAAPFDTDELRSVMEKARQHGDLEAHYQNQRLEIRKAEADANAGLKKLRLWTGTLESLENLPVPSPETIERYEQGLREAEDAVKKQQADMDELEHALLENKGRIEQLRLEQEVPTEADLYQAREKREQSWQFIRKADFPLPNDVAETYESEVQQADTIADRLRREADKVVKKAGLLAERETLKNKFMRSKKQAEKAGEAFNGLKKEWLDIWEPLGISPKSPREMRAWVQKQMNLATQVSAIREQHIKAENLKTQIDTFRRELINCLEKLDEFTAGEEETLTHLLEKSRQIAERMDKLRASRDKFSSELEQRDVELRERQTRAENINEELSRWRSQWAGAVETLGLDADATPGQANAVTDDLKTLFVKLKEANHYRLRIEGIDRDAAEFDEKVMQFAEHDAPDLLKLPTDQIVTELNARLTRARAAKTQWQNLEKQRQKEEKQLRTAKNKIAKIHGELTAMCEEAGCESYESLPAAEEHSARRKEIQVRLEEMENELRKLSAGATLDQFIQDARSVDPDSIDPHTDQLREEADILGQKKSEIDQTIGKEQNEISRMNGSARAAELAEESQSILAALETDVEQYVRFRLASTVLNQAIERYREKSQGPILTRSNELFTHMTLGSFEGLRLDFNEKGDAALVGVRPGGREIVSVDGMSDGTADQLYLAVRIASLEAYLEKNEAMPFIVDDILIKFDDERAIATLEVLARLSEKTQIIFFTHHRHLLELAEKCADDGVLFTHSLSNGGSL